MDQFEKLDKKVDSDKKLDKVATKLTKAELDALSDEDVTEISGGFIQKAGVGYSGGVYIECPSCHNGSKNSIKLLGIDNSECVDSYRCKKCGFEFGIDYDGQYYDISIPGNPMPTGMYTP